MFTATAASASATSHAAAKVGRPAVAKLSTRLASVRGGHRITVRGTNFVHVRSVRFGRVAGRSVHVLSRKKLTVIVPAHRAGTVDVRVVTTTGTSKRRARDHFAYIAAPKVSAVTPSRVVGASTRVTVRGANFRSVTKVRFGTVAGTAVHVLSRSELQVTSPAHALGTVDVRVTTKFGTSALTSSDRYTYAAPVSAVQTLAVVDSTATTVRLDWLHTPGVATALTVRRIAGATPPSATTGTQITELPAGAVGYQDTGLSAGMTYSYGVFATDVPTGVVPALITATTNATNRPSAPTGLSLSPAPSLAASDGSCVGDAGWIGHAGQLALLTHTANPDSPLSGVRAEFEVRDLGADGTSVPVDLITAADQIGWTSLSPNGSDSSGFKHLAVDGLLTDGHRYETDAVASDGTSSSLPGPVCRFGFDASAPNPVDITADSTSAHVGQPVTFTVSSADVVPSDGGYSGIDHFSYSTNSSAEISGTSGTHVAALGSGASRTASFTVTPTAWGTNYLYVTAVDAAGNHSETATYSYYAQSA